MDVGAKNSVLMAVSIQNKYDGDHKTDGIAETVQKRLIRRQRQILNFGRYRNPTDAEN